MPSGLDANRRGTNNFFLKKPQNQKCFKVLKIRKKHEIPVSDFIETLNQYINELDPQGYYG